MPPPTDAARAVRKLRGASITSLDGGKSASGGGSSAGGLVIGTANFTENQILGHLYAEALRAEGVKATVKPNLGSREIVVPALRSGDIDLLPEYQGSLLPHLDDSAKATEGGDLQNALTAALPNGIEALPYAAAENKDVFVVTRETAEKRGLRSMTDLTKYDGELVFGGPAEDKKRVVGLVGLKDEYGVTFREFKALDTAGPLVKGALKKGQIDVGNLFSTDADIEENGWVALADPKSLIPAQHIVPLVRSGKNDLLVRRALARLGSVLTTDELARLDALVDKDKKDPDRVAAAWAAEHGLTKK
ncbi:ABC transporter substrate-binding protein [Streptomyces sp. H27-D2]|uniref:ABC transporter substrate-binding protein n=1 Tax=Streptomyces sp. H27-D2 TaxID=3046304 RepID=UPI002DC02035|nr:ABC transporter substrate-binding protein [Streptomyces sp. H27-D2]MEC4017347.1 ABC transporter substrate-binding protein [Streptomyces sp. H27-D2]